MKRNPIKHAMAKYYNSITFKKIKPRLFYHQCNKCGNEFKNTIMYECGYDDDYFTTRHYYLGCSECFKSKKDFMDYCYANIILPKDAWQHEGKLCTPIVKRMLIAAEKKVHKSTIFIDNKTENTNTYYKDMPDDFKQAVNVIKQYCQFEECSDDCSNCPHPLRVIRCGDVINGEENE